MRQSSLIMGLSNKFVFIILLSHVAALNKTFEASLSDTIAQICPFQRSCSSDMQEDRYNISSVTRSCCQQCSCDTSCSLIEACCLDQKSNPSNTSDANVACHSAIFSMSTFEPDYQYIAVDKCPGTYANMDTVLNCNISSPKTFKQAQIVSDNYEMIYKNSYCAVCNGVELFNRWLPRVDCEEQLDDQTGNANMIYWLENNCRVWFEEPENQTFLTSRCYRAQIDSCNMTNTWTRYDPFIENTCRTMQTGRYITQNIVYKNIFCFLCNQVEGEQICTNRTTGVRLDFYSFSAILKFVENPKTDAKSDTNQKDCDRGEIYDYFKDVCRELKCPSLNIPSNGQCMPLFDGVVGYGVEIATTLKPTSQLNISAIDRRLLVANTIASMMEQVDHKNVYSCDVCEYLGVSDVSLPDEPSSYVFIRIKTTQKCQLADLYNIADYFHGLELTVNLESSVVNFITRIIAKTASELKFSTVRSGLIKDLHQLRPCKGTWTLYENKCAHVELNGVDYLDGLEKNYIDRKKHRSTFKQLKRNSSKELEELRYDVCVDEYIVWDEGLASVNSFEKINAHGVLITYLYVMIQLIIQL